MPIFLLWVALLVSKNTFETEELKYKLTNETETSAEDQTYTIPLHLFDVALLHDSP
jgi:hypothetical protein